MSPQQQLADALAGVRYSKRVIEWEYSFVKDCFAIGVEWAFGPSKRDPLGQWKWIGVMIGPFLWSVRWMPPRRIEAMGLAAYAKKYGAPPETMQCQRGVSNTIQGGATCPPPTEEARRIQQVLGGP